MNFESVEFFKEVTDKVGKGSLNERGAKDGEWRGYVEGRLEWIAHYNDGFMEGKAEIVQHPFYECFEGNIVNACMTGMWTAWLKKRIGRVGYIQFYLGDMKHGPYQRFYPRGNALEVTGMYAKGVRTGEWNIYSASGEVNVRRLYDSAGNPV